MHFEVFHRGLLGRHDIVAVDMIQYSGLWGVCFSHHHPHNNFPRYAADTTTEGVLRFLADAAEDRALGSPAGAVSVAAQVAAMADYTITTHHFDADSLLPVWALLNPQAALERRDLLERVARCGDFFIYLDDTSARLNFVVEALHLRLRDYGQRGDRLVDDTLTRRCFEWLLPRWGELLENPDAAADLWRKPMDEMLADIAYLSAPGRVTELWEHHTSLVESDHALDPHALNTVCRNDILLVWRTDANRHGTTRRIVPTMDHVAPTSGPVAPTLDVRPAVGWYDLRSLPHCPRYDLADLNARLNAAERAAGHAPGWQDDAGPAWLRADASGLSQQALLDAIKHWIDAAPEAHIPAAYRAGVHERYPQLPHHPIFTSQRAFADAPMLRFVPGAPYEGLHIQIENAELRIENNQFLILNSQFSILNSVQLAVSDDFYWNRRRPAPLELLVRYQDRGAGRLWVEYDTWDDPFRPTPPHTLLGDGAEHTTSFRLPDARLGNSQDWGDLRLVCDGGGQMAIEELVLRRG